MKELAFALTYAIPAALAAIGAGIAPDLQAPDGTGS